MDENCISCEVPMKGLIKYFCDVATPGGPYCSACFEKLPCGQGKHDEGCQTMVFGD